MENIDNNAITNSNLSDSAIEQAINEVLAQPEFRPPPIWEDWFRNFFDKFENFADFLKSSFGTIGIYIFISILTIILVILLVHMGYVFFRELKFMRSTKAIRVLEPGELMGISDQKFNCRDSLLKAKDAFSKNDLYQTVWVIHRLFLRYLHENNVINFSKWKTNSEYLNECPRKHNSYPLLLDLNDTYEHIIYAHTVVSQDRVSNLIHRVEQHCQALA